MSNNIHSLQDDGGVYRVIIFINSSKIPIDKKESVMGSMRVLEERLLKKIESLRQTMNRTGIEKGFNDQETIKISQQLDHYILKYQQLKIV